jgi:hypothetical protein
MVTKTTKKTTKKTVKKVAAKKAVKKVVAKKAVAPKKPRAPRKPKTFADVLDPKGQYADIPTTPEEVAYDEQPDPEYNTNWPVAFSKDAIHFEDGTATDLSEEFRSRYVAKPVKPGWFKRLKGWLLS